MDSKEERAKSAKENWNLAYQADQQGNKEIADAARRRAIEDEKCRDSWLYRTFGW